MSGAARSSVRKLLVYLFWFHLVDTHSAVVYGTMTAHPAFMNLRSSLEKEMVLSVLGAKALSAYGLVTLSGLRLLISSGLLFSSSRPSARSSRSQSKEKKTQ